MSSSDWSLPTACAVSCCVGLLFCLCFLFGFVCVLFCVLFRFACAAGIFLTIVADVSR